MIELQETLRAVNDVLRELSRAREDAFAAHLEAERVRESMLILSAELIRVRDIALKMIHYAETDIDVPADVLEQARLMLDGALTFTRELPWDRVGKHEALTFTVHGFAVKHNPSKGHYLVWVDNARTWHGYLKAASDAARPYVIAVKKNWDKVKDWSGDGHLEFSDGARVSFARWDVLRELLTNTESTHD